MVCATCVVCLGDWGMMDDSNMHYVHQYHHPLRTITRCAAFLADDLFVAAGFDGEPWLMVRDDEGAWVLAMSLLAGVVGVDKKTHV